MKEPTMTDQSSAVREFAPPRQRQMDKGLNSLAEVLGRHVDATNQMTSVQAIAAALKSLTYDEAQQVGAGLAHEIEANKDKDTGFDFSTSPIKMAPVLTHLVQTWASTVCRQQSNDENSKT
jgi:hypothetical protein